MRSRAATVAIVGLIACLHSEQVLAHAGPRLTDPIEGATLGDTPTIVRLSFSEKPEASLSLIRVLDTGGAAYQIGSPEHVQGDPLALFVAVRPLATGVYIVNWRIISAVDGHVTAGAYAFGVRTSPLGTTATSTSYPPASLFEVLARWALIAGLVTLLGALAAALVGFGGARDLSLAAGGWLLAVIGALLLAEAQRRTAAVSFPVLLSASLGRMLVWRTVAIGAAGAALVAAYYGTRPTRPLIRRAALAGAALATMAAIAIHVGAGHAAAGSGWLKLAVVSAQWAHFSSAGIWIGGLAALLLGIRGAPSDVKAAAVRRFSDIAAICVFIVAATGIARAVSEVTSWTNLTSTAYGGVVAAKIALMMALAALGALNRWRSVPAAATRLRPLRRAAGGELVLMTAALVAAAALGTLPPSAAVRAAGLVGISVSGSDFGTSVRARLTTISDQPGPNRFTLSLADYDSRKPISTGRVSLRFTPLDDPGVASTSLQLVPGGPATDHAFVGSGANLAFDGRWQVTARIEREGDSVEVPMELETRAVWQPFVIIAQDPGETRTYTVDVSGGTIRISPDPERAGPSTLRVTCYDQIGDPRPVDAIVVTATADGASRQLPVRHLGRGRFVADLNLRAGRNRIAAVGRTADGTRLRAVFSIDVPRK